MELVTMSELFNTLKNVSFKNFRSGFNKNLNLVKSFNFQASITDKAKFLNEARIPLLAIIFIASTSYWVMKFIQMPSSTLDHNTHQTLVISEDQKLNQSKSLFGNIQLSTQNILLRGIVITSNVINQPLDGYAIFEINGKPSAAISIGDVIGNGLKLKSIKQDSVIMSYLDQDIEYPLASSKSEASIKASK
jgi:type II secretory pathway component PulC